MALATRCPNCQALFRVVAEQLRSRGGMVRCGSCRSVFNAIAGLDYLDGQPLSADNADVLAVPGSAPPLPHPRSGAASTGAGSTGAGSPGAGSRWAAAEAATQPATDSAAQSTLASGDTESRGRAQTPPGAHDAPPGAGRRRRAGDSAGVDLETFAIAPDTAETAAQADPHAGPATLYAMAPPRIDFDAVTDDASAGSTAEGLAEGTAQDAQDAPSFLRNHPSEPRPGARIALGVGMVALAAGLVVQLALLLRSPLIVALPALRPALQALCEPLGCTASWPMRPDMLAVVSSELEAVPGTDIFELGAVLRNRAAFAVAAPAIELTISDDIGHTVVRRVFLPADYLAAGPEGKPEPGADRIGASADFALRIRFAFPGGNAASFEAYPFYP